MTELGRTVRKQTFERRYAEKPLYLSIEDKLNIDTVERPTIEHGCSTLERTDSAAITFLHVSLHNYAHWTNSNYTFNQGEPETTYVM